MSFAFPQSIPDAIATSQSSFDAAIGDSGNTCDLFGSVGGFLDGIDFGGATRAIDDVLSDIGDVIADAIKAAGTVMAEINNAMNAVLTPLLEAANDLFDNMNANTRTAVEQAISAFNTAISTAMSVVNAVFEGLSSAFSALTNALVSGLKQLGAVNCGVASKGIAQVPTGASSELNLVNANLAQGAEAVGSAVMQNRMVGVADGIQTAATSMATTSNTQVGVIGSAVASMRSALETAIADATP